MGWILALALVALPVVAVVNGWVGGERWPLRTLRVQGDLHAGRRVAVARGGAAICASRGFFAVQLIGCAGRGQRAAVGRACGSAQALAGRAGSEDQSNTARSRAGARTGCCPSRASCSPRATCGRAAGAADARWPGRAGAGRRRALQQGTRASGACRRQCRGVAVDRARQLVADAGRRHRRGAGPQRRTTCACSASRDCCRGWPPSTRASAWRAQTCATPMVSP